MPGEMIRTSTFWLLWLMFVFAATAGLMTLGNVKTAALAIDPLADAVVIVGVMSLLNAAGRIVWGATSDKLGRENTMMLMFLVLAVGMFAFAWMSTISISWLAVMGIASLIGFCFGGNFALFKMRFVRPIIRHQVLYHLPAQFSLTGQLCDFLQCSPVIVRGGPIRPR